MVTGMRPWEFMRPEELYSMGFYECSKEKGI
jgi:hypothetical protein